MRKEVTLRIEGMELQRLRVVICGSCRHADGERCGKTGNPLVRHIGGEKCPIGAQADDNGWVRWIGVRWIGVPYPVRLWRSVRSFNRAWMLVPGCGCVLKLKRLYKRMGLTK